jgi:hypothetical protein
MIKMTVDEQRQNLVDKIRRAANENTKRGRIVRAWVWR